MLLAISYRHNCDLGRGLLKQPDTYRTCMRQGNPLVCRIFYNLDFP